jgi:tRNA threonylcarbamoyladenosine biosynthesis protein TsaE
MQTGTEVRIENLDILAQEAKDFVLRLTPQDESAILVTLSGELGAGKTAFTKAVAEALGVEEVVNSPTFVLEKVYLLPATRSVAGFTRLVHIDAYRLEGGAELGPLGFDELMKDPGNLVMLEWPEKVADALPAATIALSLKALPDGIHTITYAN